MPKENRRVPDINSVLNLFFCTIRAHQEPLNGYGNKTIDF